MGWQKKTNDGPDLRTGVDWRRRVAVHEAGHAVLAWASPYVTEVGFIALEMKTLWPDQVILAGVTAYSVSPTVAADPRHLWNQIVIGLGGMAAEAFMLRSIKSRGCTVDLMGAKGYAEIIRGRRGAAAMDWLPWDDDGEDAGRGLPDIADMFVEPIDPTVRDILNACCRRAKLGVAAQPQRLAALMNALMADDRLNNDQLWRLLGPRPLWC